MAFDIAGRYRIISIFKNRLNTFLDNIGSKSYYVGVPARRGLSVQKLSFLSANRLAKGSVAPPRLIPSAKHRHMARPRKPSEQARTRRVEIRLTDAEEKTIQEQATGRGITISDLFRLAALGLKPRLQRATPWRAALIKGLAELGKIGSNVNQVSRAINRSERRVPTEVITNVLKNLQTLSTQLIRMLSDGDTR